jgi:hypothetical protein
VIFDCRALNGYDRARAIVDRLPNQPLFAAAQNDEQKMDVVSVPISTFCYLYYLANFDLQLQEL